MPSKWNLKSNKLFFRNRKRPIRKQKIKHNKTSPFISEVTMKFSPNNMKWLMEERMIALTPIVQMMKKMIE